MVHITELKPHFLKITIKLNYLFSFERTRTKGSLERSRSPYHYDRYPHRPPMVNLRFGQGRPQPPTTSTTINARIAQEEVRHHRIISFFTCGPKNYYKFFGRKLKEKLLSESSKVSGPLSLIMK